MSARNNCIAALEATIRAAVTVPVERDETRARAPGKNGIILLREGEGEVEQVILGSPLLYQMRHTAQVVVMLQQVTTVAAARAKMDALLVGISAAIEANRTLNTLAVWAEPLAPSFEEEEVDGGGALLAASIPVEIQFTAPGSPLG